MAKLILTLCVALIIGGLLYRMKMPAGLLVGALLGTAFLGVTMNLAYMPKTARFTAQIIAGAFIASSVQKKDFNRIKKLLKPASILLAGMLCFNILSGFVIYYTSPLDLMTSFMSAVPGGMSDVPIISGELGANMSQVAAVQFARMLSAVGVFPSLILFATPKVVPQHLPVNDLSKHEALPVKSHMVLGILLSASVAGFIGQYLKIPAGALLFALIGGITFNIVTVGTTLPRGFKRVAQVLSGAFIGSSITANDLLTMRFLVWPILYLLTGYFMLSFCIGFAISRSTGMSLREGMLVATPGGASDMALIASDLGVQSTDIVLLQLIRLIIVIAVFPQIIVLIVKLVGG